MPLFTDECAKAVEREGFDLQHAVADFVAGKDLRDEYGQAFRYGRFGVYQYEERLVFGRYDELVTHVWLRENV